MERDAQTEPDLTPADDVPAETPTGAPVVGQPVTVSDPTPAPAVEPLAAPADQGSGLASPIRHSRAELRAVERQREQETRRVPHGSVVAVWVVAALLFVYSFWQGLVVLSAPPALLGGLTGGQRTLSALVGAALPLVAYGAAVWSTRHLSWWRAVIVFAAAWGASAAVWITFVFAMHPGH